MKIIFEEPRYFEYDKRTQVEEKFLECFKRLEDMVSEGFIPDIIFHEVNVFRFDIWLVLGTNKTLHNSNSGQKILRMTNR